VILFDQWETISPEQRIASNTKKPMNRTDRLLGVLLELQRKKWVRAEDLAARFETSKRTIYRDVMALCETGVPIRSQSGLGYSLVEGYFLPPVSFTSDEAIMLLLGSDFAAQNFDAQYHEAARAANRKIEAVISEHLRQEVQYLQNSIAFVTPENQRESINLLSRLRTAIIERQQIRFNYHTRYTKGGKSERNLREADPYGLVHFGEAWYLIAYCHLRKDFRTFKLDRLSELILLEKIFKRRPEFKMEKPADVGRTLEVKVLFDLEIADWVKESRLYYISATETTAEGFLVTLHLHTEDELMDWLLSWGSRMRILQPESLRLRVIAEAEKIIKKNS
jgi:predicted DNA-binding transcriptional regulator YafY